MSEPRIRCGDHVHHAPSGEDWVVAFADYETGELAWCGWPEGLARIADCTLAKAATDEEHFDQLSAVIKSGGMRGGRAARIYPFEAPVAWLWQNAPVLEDGCFQFHPTAARANAEIAHAGGWKTPVFARPERVEHGDVPTGKSIFFGLDDWRAGWPRLNVSIGRATAIKTYMAAERAAPVDSRAEV